MIMRDGRGPRTTYGNFNEKPRATYYNACIYARASCCGGRTYGNIVASVENMIMYRTHGRALGIISSSGYRDEPTSSRVVIDRAGTCVKFSCVNPRRRHVRYTHIMIRKRIRYVYAVRSSSGQRIL